MEYLVFAGQRQKNSRSILERGAWRHHYLVEGARDIDSVANQDRNQVIYFQGICQILLVADPKLEVSRLEPVGCVVVGDFRRVEP